MAEGKIVRSDGKGVFSLLVAFLPIGLMDKRDFGGVLGKFCEEGTVAAEETREPLGVLPVLGEKDIIPGLGATPGMWLLRKT